jgi:hypothetical protein
VSSLKFPIVVLLVTFDKERFINDRDAQWIAISEGVHSLGWAGREEESWRKFMIIVGECQWVVGLFEI